MFRWDSPLVELGMLQSCGSVLSQYLIAMDRDGTGDVAIAFDSYSYRAALSNSNLFDTEK